MSNNASSEYWKKNVTRLIVNGADAYLIKTANLVLASCIN
jgi:hypothetical protein